MLLQENEIQSGYSAFRPFNMRGTQQSCAAVPQKNSSFPCLTSNCHQYNHFGHPPSSKLADFYSMADLGHVPLDPRRGTLDWYGSPDVYPVRDLPSLHAFVRISRLDSDGHERQWTREREDEYREEAIAHDGWAGHAACWRNVARARWQN